MKKSARKISLILLTIICTVCLACGLSACKPKKSPIDAPENATTYRLKTPNDGSLPTAHTALENIGYMAYTLDNQPYYHTYAHTSSKAMGYEQVTRSWKDHKGEKESGYAGGVTIGSDISYSALSKSASQGCYIGANDGYMRGGSKPGKSTTPLTEDWSTDAPTYYSKEKHLKTYGEFPNEISVYVINEDTIDDADDVVDNGDGTYTQKYYLGSEAACWYQYGLKTRGSLKGYPKYKSLEISFTFDAQWQILTSYCEEKTEIAPSAMGGMPAKTTSKTSVEYTYGADAIDEEHYAFIENYFKQHLGNKENPVEKEDPDDNEPDVITILGSGFSKVLTAEGQQFGLDLTVGSTQYEGKAFACVADADDILNSLDVRLSLGKKSSGRQDLYIGFSQGNVNAYYSDDFALTANVGAFGAIINQFSEWANRFKATSVTPAAYSLAAEEEEDGALAALLASLKHTVTDVSATVSLVTDDLLGTGIGADVKLNFSRTKSGDSDKFDFTGGTINSITYSKSGIALSLVIAPDGSSSKISHDKASAPADVKDYADSVCNMLNSETLKVSLGIDGAEDGVIDMLSGVKLNVDSFVALGSDMAAKVDISLEVGGVCAKLSAYYNVNIHSGDYGAVYLTLTEVDGKAMNARIKCNINSTIEAVESLLAVINESSAAQSGAPVKSPAAAAQAENKTAELINKVLNLNFSKIFGEIYASNSEIRLAVSIDEILGGLGLNIADIKFGTAALALSRNADGKASLALNLPALGLTMGVEGSSTSLAVPDESKYTDVNDFIALVKAAVVEVKDVIAAQDIAFDVDTKITVDGVTFAVKGGGEAVWGENTRVALDVKMYVADGTNESKKDAVAVKFLYDDAVEENQPLIRLAVNDLGIEIYRSDLENTGEYFNGIKDALDRLLNGEKQTETTPAQAAQAAKTTAVAGARDITDIVSSLLQNSNVQNVLKAVLGFVGDVKAELTYGGDPARLQSVLLTHAVNGSLAVGVDGKLWLALDAYTEDTTDPDNKIQVVYLDASVAKGDGSLAVDFTGVTFDAAKDAADKFVKVVYNYLFKVIEDLTVQEMLGSDTYAAALTLDGANSAIPALEKVKIEANLYYTHGIENGVATSKKLAEVDLNLDINGLTVIANARYADECIYAELTQISNVKLTDIKFKTDVHDIYSVAEQIVSLVLDTDLLDVITGTGDASAAAVKSAAAVTAETRSSLTDAVAGILTLDFAKAFSFEKVDGVNTVTVNPDYVAEKVGLGIPEIGTVIVGVNPKTHAIEATAKTASAKAAWVTLSAAPVERRAYPDNWRNGYTDVGFVATIVKDITNTAVTDGKLNTLYTFESGSIDIDISYSVISTSVRFTNVKLTAGLDENGNFYFVLTAHLNSQSFLMYDVAKEWDVSIAYSNGYIIMGRELGSATEKYKVMTLEYLLENLMDKDNSPIRWLLGTSSGAWNLVADNVKLNINTGLTRPKTYYLYEQLAQAKLDKEHNIALSDYINAMAVKLGGYGSAYGSADMSGTVLKGVNDNYYAFDINPEIIGTVSKLQAAILRGENGLTGVNAYAAIGSNLMLNVKLGGLSADTDSALGNPLTVNDGKGTVAGKTYTYNNIDFNNPEYINSTAPQDHVVKTFGCYTYEHKEEDEEKYEACWMLEPHTFTVTDENNEVALTIENVPYGSTVNLTNVFAPNWTTDNRTHVYGYADENGNAYGNSVIVEGDLTVYSCTVAAYPVDFHIDRNGIGTVAGALSLGDAVPEYPSDFGDCVFMGWYTDASYNTEVNTYAAGITDLYARYVAKNYEGANGVKYTLGANGEYSVVGFNAEKIVGYTAIDTTLYIENVIDGYPVTSIAANAFEKAGVKNVVVPENVTYVGSLAFLDNIDMRTAVFLAETVTFGGARGEKSDGGYPFYGCIEAAGGQLTNLSIYYNAITGSNDDYEGIPGWAHVYTPSKGKYRFVGHNGGTQGSELVGKDRYERSINDTTRTTVGDKWAYVTAEINFVNLTVANQEDIDLSCIPAGLTRKALAAEEIEQSILWSLNAYTQAKGYVNAFTVEVNGEVSLGCSAVTLTVTVTEKPQNTWYYALTLTEKSATGAGAQITCGNADGIDGIYVKAGETVTLTPKQSSYEFASLPVCGGVTFAADGDGGYTFAMPEGAITVEFTLQEVAVNEVVLHSAVAFTYGGATVTGNDASGYAATLTGVDESTTLIAAASTDYTFVGWAYADGNALKFVQSDRADRQTDYYAIWAVTRTDANYVYEANATLPAATSDNGTLYAWYKAEDTAFTGDTVTALTTENTVLRARMEYKLVFTAGGTDTQTRYTYNTGVESLPGESSYNENKGAVLSDNLPLDILEGYTVKVSRYWSDGIIIRISEDDKIISNYLIIGFKTNGNSFSNPKKGSKRAQFYDSSHYLELNDGWMIADNISTVAGIPENRCYATYNNDNDQLFASTTVSGNLTVHSQM